MNNIIDIFLQLGIFAKIIIALLFILSFSSWAIIFDKVLKNRKIRKESQDFFNLFSTFRSYQDIIALSKEFKHSPYPRIVNKILQYIEKRRSGKDAGNDTGSQPDSAQSANRSLSTLDLNSFLEGAIIGEISILEKNLIILSTTVSVSPFLGLLGTVWGIMSAFLSIGLKGSADIATIGPGIAEALITTIVGLAVAIPALIGYNFFIDRIRQEENRVNVFSRDLIQLIEREKK